VAHNYSFAYQTDNREEIGLVQVFDDGLQTYLQVPSAGDATTRLLDEKGQSITPIRNGAFLVIPGVHSALTLERAEGLSHINREERAAHVANKARREGARTAPTASPKPIAAPTEPPAPGGPARGAPIATVAPPAGSAAAAVELAGMQSTVLRFESEVQALEREIADEQQALAQTRQLLAHETRTQVFVVHFANNSARAELSQEEIASIVEVSKDAQALVIEGYTDAYYPNAAGAKLAQARADNVANILARGGVKRDAMNIEFHSAGGFARENTTDSGKAFNRRVAISVRFPETFSPG